MAMEAFISEGNFSDISIWKFNSAFELERIVCVNGYLDSRLLFIDEDLFPKCIGNLRESVIIPEVDWDTGDVDPKRNRARERFTGKRLPTFQSEAPLVEVTWTKQLFFFLPFFIIKGSKPKKIHI